MQDIITSFAVGFCGFFVGIILYLRGVYRGAEEERINKIDEDKFIQDTITMMKSTWENMSPQNSNSDKNSTSDPQ